MARKVVVIRLSLTRKAMRRGIDQIASEIEAELTERPLPWQSGVERIEVEA